MYTTTTEDLERIPQTTGELGKDLAMASGTREKIPSGTRVRLHYPMVSLNGGCYMTEACVHPDSGQFEMNHVRIYTEGEADCATPIRHVGPFEV